MAETVERRSSLSSSGPEEAAPSRDEEAADRRRLRVRRWAVLVLAVTTAAFLLLEYSGAVPHAFSRHGPLLAFSVYLMIAFTFRPMPPGARKDPASHAFLAMIAFWFFAGLALQLKELWPDKAGLFQGIYLGLGGASLIAAVWLSRKPLQPAAREADPAPRNGWSSSGKWGRSHHYRKMHSRGALAFSLVVLAFLAWGQLVQDLSAARVDLEHWQIAPVWHREGEGDLRWLGVAHGGGGAPVAVAQWGEELRVLDTDGSVRAEGAVRPGAQVALGDLDADGRDEVLVVTAGAAAGPPSLQALDLSLAPLGAAARFPGLGRPLALLALELSREDSGAEVALADSRGCVSTFSWLPGLPGASRSATVTLLWEDYFVDALGSGEPLFLASLQYGETDQVVAARGNGGLRVSSAYDELRWEHEVEGGIHRILASPLHHNHAGEVIAVGPAGRLVVVDINGSRRVSVDLEQPARSLAVLEYAGSPESWEIAVGDAGGKIVLLDDQGRQLDDWNLGDGKAPVVALLTPDLDRDGREDLIGGLENSRIHVVQTTGVFVSAVTPEPPRQLAMFGDLVLAAGGSRVEAWRVSERVWLQQYRPLLGPGLFTLAILLAGVPVFPLHPRSEDWEDWEDIERVTPDPV